MMELIYQMFPLALMMATPLILGALGGLFSERAGIVNIAIDGTMQVGAFLAMVCVLIFEANGWPYAKWVALLVAFIGGAIFISIHAIASIHFKADQTVSGTAVNVLAGGLTIYLCQIMYNGARSTDTISAAQGFAKFNIPFLSDIPVIGRLLFTNVYATTLLAFALIVVSWFIIYKTPFGLRLRSCGEYPQASASMGIDVVKMRWIAELISGGLSGLAGAVLVLTTATFYYSGTVHGLGFVAVATLIFGQWSPWGVLGAGVFFGFAQVLGLYSSSIPLLENLPSEFFSMFPYVITIVALVLFSGRSMAPKASGEIYDAGKR